MKLKAFKGYWYIRCGVNIGLCNPVIIKIIPVFNPYEKKILMFRKLDYSGNDVGKVIKSVNVIILNIQCNVNT